MGVGFLIMGLICCPTGVALGIRRIRTWESHRDETTPFRIPVYFFGMSRDLPWGSREHKWLYIGSAFGFGLAGLSFILVGAAAVLNIIEF